MTKRKKALLLSLTLAMSATVLAACGGKGGGNDDLGGGNIQGEQIMDAAAWTQSLSDTAAATNATISMKIKGEERMGEFFEKGESVVTAKVAEDKVYVYEKTDASWYFEEDGVVDRDEEHDEDQTYIAMVDGVATRYFKELEQDWQISEWYSDDFSATVGFVLNWYADFNPTYVSGMYDAFKNNNGMYTCTQKDDDEDYSSTAQLKFVDGQIAWGKISESSTRSYDGQTMTGTWEVVFAITYGDTTIGALPGQEEEPDVGEDSSSAGGEIGGDNSGEEIGGEEVDFVMPEIDFDNTLGNDIVGEQVSTDELAEAIDKALAATNFTMKGHSLVQGGRSLVQSNVANGKSYNVTRATYPTTEGTTETTEMHMIVGEVDGTAYAWMSFDKENWDCAPADEIVVGGWKDGNEVFGPYLSMFKLLTPVFDQHTGEFSVIVETMTISIKIVNGEVKMIHIEDSDLYVTEVIEYGNAVNFKLPPVENADGGSMDSVVGGDSGSAGGEMNGVEEN